MKFIVFITALLLAVLGLLPLIRYDDWWIRVLKGTPVLFPRPGAEDLALRSRGPAIREHRGRRRAGAALHRLSEVEPRFPIDT